MTSLQPNVMLISRSVDRSAAAIALRSGGYGVTKVNEDDYAVRLASGGSIDAVVLDLPILNAITCAKRFREISAELPILVVTSFVQTVQRSADVAVITPIAVEEEIVRTIDRLLVDRELAGAQTQHG